MKKTVFTLSILLSFAFGSFSQTTLDLKTQHKLQKMSPSDNKVVDVLIQGDLTIIKELVQTAGGKFKSSAGDIANVTLPMNQLPELVTHHGITRIETFPEHLHPLNLNDTLLKNSNVVPAHNGQAPLTQGYDGTGVVIGFIDTGIDWSHGDFKDATGHSRIKWLWDHNLPNAANTPAAYGYGQEFSNTDIDAGLAAASNDLTYSGHGTHVAGIGAGNGLSAGGHYIGVAPGADIIMVALNFSTGANIVDGASYIFAKAAAMGKPCVVNISIGSNDGSHDGADLQSQYLNNMILSQPGRAMVAAVGNDGYTPYHLGYNVTSDTNFTLMGNTAGGNVDFQIYANVTDLANVHFSIGADQMTPVHAYKGHTPYTLASSHTGTVDYDTVFNSSHQRLGIVESFTQLYTGPTGSAYFLEYLVIPDSLTYDWRLSATGSGKFDLWNYDYNIYWTDLIYSGLPSAATMPDSIYYKMPDVAKTVCSSFQCLTNVITVGNYTNRRSYVDVLGALYVDTTKVPGRIDASSALGPTRDGRLKPDVCSPGDMTMAAVVRSLIPGIVSSYPDALSVDSMHVRDGGSSHSSPGVAGVAALYLQQNPTATAAQVKNAINNCTTVDGFTGTVPNNTWGHGKVNAFGVLTNCAVGIPENISPTDNSLLIYPNPSSYGNTINIGVSGYKPNQKTEVKIVNALGEFVKTITITSSNASIGNTLPAGVYFCTLYINGKLTASQKMVVVK
jgi:subtilisin family serine protease